jgi:hypothetical protein
VMDVDGEAKKDANGDDKDRDLGGAGSGSCKGLGLLQGLSLVRDPHLVQGLGL